MKDKKNALGFVAAEAVLILVIIALVGLVGYKVYSTRSSTDKIASDTTAVSQQTPQNVSSLAANAPAVNSTSDLDKAEKALTAGDTSALDSSDSSQLNNQLSNF